MALREINKNQDTECSVHSRTFSQSSKSNSSSTSPFVEELIGSSQIPKLQESSHRLQSARGSFNNSNIEQFFEGHRPPMKLQNYFRRKTEEFPKVFYLMLL